jgi:hypothetical protein
MSFTLDIKTPQDELSFLCTTSSDSPPRRVIVCYNSLTSSYYIERGHGRPPTSEVLEASDTDQSFTAAKAWLLEEGYPVVNAVLVKQRRPKDPLPFNPNRTLLPQRRRPLDPAPRAPRHLARPSEATLVPHSSDEEQSQRPSRPSSRRHVPIVLRRHRSPGPSRSLLSRVNTPEQPSTD